MILNTQCCIRSGAYSEIFRSVDGTKVFKLFISGNHPSNVAQGLTDPDHDTHRKNTFLAECEAYTIAMAQPTIRAHVPHFYGRVEISDVLNDQGQSVASHYLRDCCYGLQRCEGTDVKLGFYGAQGCPAHVLNTLRAMKAAGIAYIKDASVFMPEDVERFKIIDFATHEIPAPILDM